MVWCKACGEKVGEPEEVLHDPDNELGIVDGGVENPDSAHIKVVSGEKGVRMQCSNTGQMTKLVDKEPSKENSGEPPSGSGEPVRGGKERPVYDLQDDRSAKDILFDVISNPIHELTDEQIQEVGQWADMYDGQIPPDTLQEVLANLSGVNKQSSKLMRQKYEIMLTRWMQDQAKDDGGPVIGAMASPAPSPGGSHSPSPTPGRAEAQRGGGPPPSRNHPDGTGTQETDEDEVSREEASDIREERRTRRVKRRQDVADEVAEQMALNIAEDMGGFYSDMRTIITTVLKRKAEKDPDWFLEKADEFGMDIIDQLSEPSQAKKKEMEEGRTKPSTDLDIEDALSNMGGGDTQEPKAERNREPNQPQPMETERTPTQEMARSESPPAAETTNSGGAIEGNEHPMSASPEPAEADGSGSEQAEGDGFDDIFGELSE